MIRLQRGTPPAVLTLKASEWTAEYLAALDAGTDRPHRYRHAHIRDSLRALTSGKCAYCEAFIEDVGYAHIEHILPRKHRPELTYVWANLTLACSRCNTAKLDYYSATAPLVNPHEDPVDDHLMFFGPMITHRTPKGDLTVTRVQLNRAELVQQRILTLAKINRILELAAAYSTEDAVVAALVEELGALLRDSSEHASCGRHYVAMISEERGVPWMPERLAQALTGP